MSKAGVIYEEDSSVEERERLEIVKDGRSLRDKGAGGWKMDGRVRVWWAGRKYDWNETVMVASVDAGWT